MNNSKLYIPKKCKVGLQKRDDTYTKKLGYVIYHDGKIWRKETSWENWRHKEGQIKNEYDYKTKKLVHNLDDNIGATINVDRTLLPKCLEADDEMVADVIWDWFNSMPAKPKPDWIVD